MPDAVTGYARGELEDLPTRRRSVTYKVKLGGAPSTYYHISEYPDGRFGEVFIDQARVGSFSQGMLNCFAIALSVGIQHGVPLAAFVHALRHSKFEPDGYVDGDPEIPFASSVIDYLMHRLEHMYLGVPLEPGQGHPVEDGGDDGAVGEG